jgi:hypothetical protein
LTASDSIRICLQHTAAEVVSVPTATGFGGMLPESDSGYIHLESLEIFNITGDF